MDADDLGFSALSNGFEDVREKDEQPGRNQYRPYGCGRIEKSHEYKGKKNACKNSNN